MPDWREYVRRNLHLRSLSSGREADIVEELAQQLDEAYRDALARGWNEEQAIVAARQHVVDWDALANDLSHTRGRSPSRVAAWQLAAGDAVARGSRWSAVARIWRDLLFAARLLRKDAGFSIVVIATLALGIGATAAAFSVVESSLWRPLAARDPGRLVYLDRVQRASPDQTDGFSGPDFLDVRSNVHLFESVAAWDWGHPHTLVSGGLAEHVFVMGVSANMFSTLGVRPLLGRDFMRGEDEGEGAPVVLLSYDFWQRHFAADPKIIGRTITMDGSSRTVIGVLPESFHFEFFYGSAAFIPIAFGTRELENRSAFVLGAIGRLRPGISQQAASAAMESIAAAFGRMYPDPEAPWSARAESLKSAITGYGRQPLFLFFAAAGCLLLIACTNVANLLLAKATVRQGEFALRVALGAGRRALVEQLLVESLFLAAAASAVGIGLAYAGVRLFVAAASHAIFIPRMDEVAMDWRALAFTTALGILTAVVMGMSPAWMLARHGVADAMKTGGRSGTASYGALRLRNTFVIAELSLALVLLAFAGLFLRSFANLRTTPLGFEPRGVLTMEIAISGEAYKDPHRLVSFYSQVLAKVRQLPGVTAAFVANRIPFLATYSVDLTTQNSAPQAAATDSLQTAITPEYFRVFEIPIIRGRPFTSEDGADAPRVAIISRLLASKFFAGQDPIGKSLTLKPRHPGIRAGEVRVVGVAADIHELGVDETQRLNIYVPLDQVPAAIGDHSFNAVFLALKTEGDPALLAHTARAAVGEADPNQAVFSVNTMPAFVEQSLAGNRFDLVLIGIFSMLALILAAIGIYGLVSYAVAQRVREIGIRMALGAQVRQVVIAVVRQSVTLAVAGVAIGVAIVILASRLLGDALYLVPHKHTGLLFGIAVNDPLTLMTVSAALLAIAALAAYAPARMASAIDPARTLRSE